MSDQEKMDQNDNQQQSADERGTTTPERTYDESWSGAPVEETGSEADESGAASISPDLDEPLEEREKDRPASS